jgi:hypothetical protein
MELILTLKGFIAFYVSGVVMSYWKLYFPSMALLKAVNEKSVILRYRWVCFVVWFFGATISLPFLVPALLFDSIGEKFIISYVQTLERKEEK